MPRMFNELQRNVRDLEALSGLYGEVSGVAGDAAPVIVAALAGAKGEESVLNYAEAGANGRYLLRVQAGKTYRLVAFADRNRNRRLDAGEPFGALDHAVTAQGGRSVGRLDFSLDSAAPLSPAERAALAGLAEVKRQELQIALGDQVDLDDPAFSPDGGKKGLWAPTDFLSEIGGGVYFLQAFDPKKTPVLFVHGAGGNPREFESLIAELDRKRFQPWVYYYPSGLRLGTVVQMLDGIVTSLRREYGFEQLVVTAHSMGGLVSMSYLKRLAARGDGRQVPLLVTLSTPWRGHEAAELGVKYAPVAIPSWIDMQVDSDFQRALFSTPMPPTTRFGLFFGYHGDSGDGTISLASQLRSEAQTEAQRVLGFDETHTSILHASAVRQAWRSLVETAAPQH